jgi:tyrosinase
LIPKYNQTKKSQMKNPKPYTSKPLKLNIEKLENNFARVDLEVHGIIHSGPSYEGRVFINNPDANANTKLDSLSGYAGSFHIFGHGGCFGDVGHCSVRPNKRPFDKRRQHNLTPAFKRITITKMINKLLRSEFIVTIVPILKATTDLCSVEDTIQFKKIKLVTYD